MFSGHFYTSITKRAREQEEVDDQRGGERANEGGREGM